jgi:hypothetical protein
MSARHRLIITFPTQRKKKLKKTRCRLDTHFHNFGRSFRMIGGDALYRLENGAHQTNVPLVQVGSSFRIFEYVLGGIRKFLEIESYILLAGSKRDKHELKSVHVLRN